MKTVSTALVLAILLILVPFCALAHEIDLHKEEPAHAPSVEEQHVADEHAGEAEAHIEEFIQNELAPIRAELEEIHAVLEAPGLTEILGGIGWIVGILGYAAYIKSRKK